MAKQSGIVEFFKDDKGYGFIKPDGGGKDVFVHHSVIQMDGFKSLKRGDRVEFEITDDPKGPRASDVRRVDDEGSGSGGGGGYGEGSGYGDEEDEEAA
jgi:CspA family cold shock protein